MDDRSRYVHFQGRRVTRDTMVLKGEGFENPQSRIFGGDLSA